MVWLINGFSANMLAEFPATVTFDPIGVEEIQALGNQGLIQSAVGHSDTAAVFAATLGTDVPPNRVTVTLQKGDVAILGQYIGPRLPEGATTLPDGAVIKWLRVKVN